jgi:hypothetical protein
MTFPVFSAGEVLRAQDMNAVGLWLVKSQTVGTGVSSVTVTGAFSADYDNYRIVYTGGTASTQTGLNLQLGSANSQYFYNLIYSLYSGGGIQILPYNGATSFVYAGAMDGNQNPFVAFDLYQPFATASTRIASQWMQTDSSGIGAGVQKANTSYTAFTLSTQTGTISGGTIFVYGYKK